MRRRGQKVRARVEEALDYIILTIAAIAVALALFALE